MLTIDDLKKVIETCGLAGDAGVHVNYGANPMVRAIVRQLVIGPGVSVECEGDDEAARELAAWRGRRPQDAGRYRTEPGLILMDQDADDNDLTCEDDDEAAQEPS